MQSSPHLRKIFTEIISWLFIVLWTYAAASKILDHETFVVQLGQSPLLTPIAGFLSWFIPLIEIVTGIFLFSSKTRLMGLYLSFGLMILFSVYIFVITHYSSNVPCSCGGILEKMSWNQHLLFNLGFVVLAVAAILAEPKTISLQLIRGNRKPVNRVGHSINH